MDTQQRKDMIRRQILSRRAALPAPERHRLSGLIAQTLFGLPEVAEAATMLTFVSVRSEVATTDILGTALAAGKRVMVPYVAEDGSMRAATIDSLDDLAPGFRGIPEPRARFPVDPATVDVAVVPGVAFDLSGARLGYGGGFFDRFLSAAPAVPRIGICFDLQVVEAIPAEAHDERMDVVVTDERVIRPATPR